MSGKCLRCPLVSLDLSDDCLCLYCRKQVNAILALLIKLGREKK